MSLTKSSEYRGTHTIVSPSRPAFLKYTDEQFIQMFHNSYKSALGDEMHLWAAIQIHQHFTCNSLREMAKSLKTFIFERNRTDRYGLSSKGAMLLTETKQISRDTYNTVKTFVNDAIAEDMEEEMELIYSEVIGGTADAARFKEKEKRLLIFDLKTGTTLAHMEQLEGYAALFCLLNNINPLDISYDLRIYQNNEVTVYEPDPCEIKDIAERIKHFSGIGKKLYKGGAV